MSKTVCSYCRMPNYGPGCTYSPTKKHRHLNDQNFCGWCGSANFGPSCPFSDNRHLHQRGFGGIKCCYCGSTALGPGCPFSPNKIHTR